jgi:hypothetical protein
MGERRAGLALNMRRPNPDLFQLSLPMHLICFGAALCLALVSLGGCAERDSGHPGGAALVRELTRDEPGNNSYVLVRRLYVWPTLLWHPAALPGRRLAGRSVVALVAGAFQEQDLVTALRSATELGHLVGAIQDAVTCAKAAGVPVETIRNGMAEVFVEMLDAEQSSDLLGSGYLASIATQGRTRAEMLADIQQLMAADERNRWEPVLYDLGLLLSSERETFFTSALTIRSTGICSSCPALERQLKRSTIQDHGYE